MKLAALYGPDAHSSLHLLVDDGFVPVDQLADAHGLPHLRELGDVGELFALGPGALDELRRAGEGARATVEAAAARFAPPVRRPSKIICVGLNYLAHIEETRQAHPEQIVLFAKFPSCLVGAGEPVILPAITSKLDYEGELAVVIGRTARSVSAADALDVVGGYTIINDISARDLQRSEPQWIRGKALDTFAPLGPIVVEARSAPSIPEMRIRTHVNGELRQDASCSLMITSVPELIEHISAAITLEPGDLIATGTPAGVAAGMAHPVYLADGDDVTVSIEGIGELSNPIAAAR